MTPLEELKASRFRDIDARTHDVLALGHVYSGVAVSLMPMALIKYLSLTQGLVLGGLLNAPVTIEAADPFNPPLVLAGLSPSAFLTSVTDKLRAIYEAESVLKTGIRNATTVAEVEAIMDTR